jgi:hypothetical protein
LRYNCTQRQRAAPFAVLAPGGQSGNFWIHTHHFSVLTDKFQENFEDERVNVLLILVTAALIQNVRRSLGTMVTNGNEFVVKMSEEVNGKGKVVPVL